MPAARSLKTIRLLAVSVLIGIVLVACGGDDEKPRSLPPTATAAPSATPRPVINPTLPSPIDFSQPDAPRGSIWLIQGASGLPNVDIYLNDSVVATRMAQTR